MRWVCIFGLLVAVAFSGWQEDLKGFFSREGYVVDVVDGKVYLDLGSGKAFPGERFTVFVPGREIVHPVTGEVLGTEERKVGRVEVLEVKDMYSIAKVTEGLGIERGQRVRLEKGSVCFSGSKGSFFKIRTLIGDVMEGEDCDYVIRELETGYGVEFKGLAVAFFEVERPKVTEVVKAHIPEVFTFKARFILSFNDLPLSADACDLFGKGKEYLVVLFEHRLEFYEVLKGEPVRFTSMHLPAGYPVSVQCADLDGDGRDDILINAISDGEASSAIARVVGESPVIVVDRIPYIMAVLDESRPGETFVGQRFEEEWGEVKRLRFTGTDVVEAGDFGTLPGFRIDGAVMTGDLLVYIDSDGYLRVYRGQDQLFSQEGFGTSYTSAEFPVAYGEGEGNSYYFYPRPFKVRVLRWELVGVVKNITSPVFRFLDVAKFTEGEIYLLITQSGKLPGLKKVQGRKLEEAVQSVVVTKDGRVFVITGRKGTIPFQNRGDLLEIEINPI